MPISPTYNTALPASADAVDKTQFRAWMAAIESAVNAASSGLPTIAAGTVLGNVGGSSAAAAAVTLASLKTALALAYTDLSGLPTLGSAAAKNVGTSAGNVVEVQAGGKLPALDGSDLTNLPSGGGSSAPQIILSNGKVAATASAGALTVAIKTAAGADPSGGSPVTVLIPDGSGGYSSLSITAALSVTVPSGQGMGFATNVAGRVHVCVIDNGGTAELALIQCVVGGATPTAVVPLSEHSPISTSAVSGAANAGVFYSTTARTSKYFRRVAVLDWAPSVMTAGTWVTPSTVTLSTPASPLPGQPIQAVRGEFATYTTTTTTVNFTSAPTSSNGIQLTTVTLTPTCPQNLLKVMAGVHGNTSAGTGDNCGFFVVQDSASAPVAADWFPCPAGYPGNGTLRKLIQSGISVSTTFKLRAGNRTSGNTFYFNGGTSSQFMGGISPCWLEVEEIAA